MNYGITHYFPGGTKENYQAVMAAMNQAFGVVLPKGQIFHAAGPAAGGWMIVAIHDSKASWDKFVAEIFLPTVQKGIRGWFQFATYRDHVQRGRSSQIAMTVEALH